MPLLLELYSGTGSVGNVFRAHGWTVVSLDKAPARGAECTHVCDIFDMTAERLLKLHGAPDVVWASPPCIQYSRARTKAKVPRDLEGADRLVAKALELIRELQPKCWFVENPYTGLLKGRPLMQGVPYVIVDYCRYGSRYKKRTALWTNCAFDGLLCCPSERCPAWDGKHPVRAQRQHCSLDELHAIPAALCERVYEECAARIAT